MRRWAALSALVTFVGCATGYGPSGFTGGYSEIRLSERMYRVRFEGNGFTSGETTKQGTLRRASALTLQSGYSHFVIFGGQTNFSQSTSTDPVNCSAIGQSVSCTGGNSHTISKPDSDMTIQMLTRREAAANPLSGAVDAQMILVQFGDISPSYITVTPDPGRPPAAENALRSIMQTAWSDESAIQLSDAFAKGYSAGFSDGMAYRRALLTQSRQLGCLRAHAEVIKDAEQDEQAKAIAAEGKRCEEGWDPTVAPLRLPGPRYQTGRSALSYESTKPLSVEGALRVFEEGYHAALAVAAPTPTGVASAAQDGCLAAAGPWAERMQKRTSAEICTVPRTNPLPPSAGMAPDSSRARVDTVYGN